MKKALFIFLIIFSLGVTPSLNSLAIADKVDETSTYESSTAVTSSQTATQSSSQATTQTTSETAIEEQSKSSCKILDILSGPLKPGTDEGIEAIIKGFGEGIDNIVFNTFRDASAGLGVPDILDGAQRGTGEFLTNTGVNGATNRLLDIAQGAADGSGVTKLYPKLSQGMLSIRGYYKQKFEYTSNVFYEPNSRDDIRWTYTPGVTVKMPFGEQKQNIVAANYEARILRYTKFNQARNIGQTFAAVSNIKLSDNAYLTANEELIKDAAPPATYFLKKVYFTDQRVTPTLGYNWNSWTFEQSYQNMHRRFPSQFNRQFSFQYDSITTRAYRDLGDRIRAVFDYSLENWDYFKDAKRSGRAWTVRAGMVGYLSSRTNVNFKVGYQDRRYHRFPNTGFRDAVADVSLVHQLTSKTTLYFTYQRMPYESTFTDNRFYDEKRFSFTALHLFTPRLRGRSGLDLMNRDFERGALVPPVFVKRVDNLADVFVGLDYLIKPWMMLGIEYKYERRNSNLSLFDYTANTLSLDLTMPF